MTLPKAKDKVQATLYQLIKHRQLTSVEISRLVNCGYAPRKIQGVESKGISIIHDMVPYTTTEGNKTMIARYTLATPKDQAIEIYLKNNPDKKAA